jgi:anti-anti-sigma regulatory factor
MDESRREGCFVVGLHGHLGVESAPDVRRTLLKRLGQQPHAVICDLSGMESMDPACTGLFLAVANSDDSGWPSTTLMLCGAVPDVGAVLIRLRVGQFLALHPSLDDALKRVRERPPYLHDQISLEPTPAAAAGARLFVREVYDYWRLAGGGPELPVTVWSNEMSLLDRAVLVASELVTNAVLHTGTRVRLRVEVRDGCLWVRVRDGIPHLMAVDRPLNFTEGGRGLVLVDALSSAWGSHQDAEGGKVVWAAFNLS